MKGKNNACHCGCLGDTHPVPVCYDAGSTVFPTAAAPTPPPSPPSPPPAPHDLPLSLAASLSHSLCLRPSVTATSNCLNSALFLYNSFPHEEQQQQQHQSHSNNNNHKNKCKKIVVGEKKMKRTEINEKKCALCDESRF